MTRLDDNGGWVLLVYGIVGATLLLAAIYSLIRARAKKSELLKIENENS